MENQSGNLRPAQWDEGMGGTEKYSEIRRPDADVVPTSPSSNHHDTKIINFSPLPIETSLVCRDHP